MPTSHRSKPLRRVAEMPLQRQRLTGDKNVFPPANQPERSHRSFQRVRAVAVLTGGESHLRDTLGRAGRAGYETLFMLNRFLDETEKFYERTLYAVPS